MKSSFRRAKQRIEVSGGESARIIRKLQGLGQNQRMEVSSIPQATVSAIETGSSGSSPDSE